MILDGSERGALHRRIDLAAAVIVLTALAWRGIVAVNIGLDGDEAYYAMWSAWLAPGYLDHPPGVAMFIAAGRLLFGETLLGVRFLALVASALTAAALFRLARLLLPHRRSAPAISVIWYSLVPIVGISFVATPDAPSTLFWTLSLWSAAEAVVGKKPRWWLAVGIFAGLGLTSKYTNAWLGVGLVLYLLVTQEGRDELRRWQLWVGGFLAVLVFSPVIWWNAVHDWRSFGFQGARIVSFKEDWGRPVLEFLLGQALAAGPILLLSSAIGMGWYITGGSRRARTDLALPVLTSLPLLLYFLFHGLHSRVEMNWTQPLLPAMTLVTVGWLTAKASWARHAAMVTQPVLGAMLIGVIYLQALLQPVDLGIVDRTRLLRGWDALAADVRRIADEAGARVIWTRNSYRLTGELFFEGRAVGDPRPVRDLEQSVRYDFIPDLERAPQSFPALLVIQTTGEPGANATAPYFSTSRLVQILQRDRQESYAVFVVSNPTSAFPGG